MDKNALQIALNGLAERGWSETKIAQEVGTTQPTINRIKKGKTRSPSYEVGAGILSLHASRRAPPSKGVAA